MALVESAAMGSRLGALEDLRNDLAVRLSACTSDQNYAVLGRLLADVLKQIDELGGGVVEKKAGTALDEFTQRLKERETTTAKAPRRAKSG